MMQITSKVFEISQSKQEKKLRSNRTYISSDNIVFHLLKKKFRSFHFENVVFEL